MNGKPQKSQRWEIDAAGWSVIRTAVEDICALAREAREIPGTVHGSHPDGLKAMNQCFAQLRKIIEQKLPDGSMSVQECLFAPHSPLALHGGHVFQSGYPIPLLLLGLVYHSRNNIRVLLQGIAGSRDALQQQNPANPGILTDSSDHLCLDGTALLDAFEKEGLRGALLLWDLFAEISVGQFYHLEKNRLFKLAQLAREMEFDGILGAVNLRLWADSLLHEGPDRQKMSPDRMRFWSVAQRHAWAGLIPDALLSVPHLDADAHREIVSQTERIIQPLQKAMAEKRQKVGGFIPIRSLGSASASARLLKILRPIERQARELPEKVRSTLGSARRGPANGRSAFREISIADLVCGDRGRKMTAYREIQQDFVAFLGASGLRSWYELQGKDEPNCPMPYPQGGQALEDRLRAPVFSLLFADVARYEPGLPEHFFLYRPSPDTSREEMQALKGMFKDVADMVNKRYQAARLLSRFPALQDCAQAWITFFEHTFMFVGCGVDSLNRLLFPAFFFSEAKYRELLANEQEWIQEIWLAIRRKADAIAACIEAEDFKGIQEALQEIFALFSQMSLRIAEQKDDEEELSSSPLTEKGISPFDVPQQYFSKNVRNIAEAREPIEEGKLPPGNPEKLAPLEERNRPHIRRLQQLQSNPLEDTMTIRGYAQSGYSFDPQRVHLYRLGHLLYRTVEYKPESAPGRRGRIIILKDHSSSMNELRTQTARDYGITLALGLVGFDVRFYMYNCIDDYFKLDLVMDSEDRSLAGKGALSALLNRKFQAGAGWNPDAAILLGIKEIMDSEAARYGAQIVIHLSDFEFCASLDDSFENAQQEMEYAATRLTEGGYAHYVEARVGEDSDPLGDTDIPHSYIHLSDPGVTGEKIEALYRIIKAVTDGDRGTLHPVKSRGNGV